AVEKSNSSTFLARPRLGHRLVRQQSEILVLSVWVRFDISYDRSHPLQVIDVVWWAKQLGVQIQSIKHFNRADTAPGKKVGSAGNKLLATRQVKIGREHSCGRRWPGRRLDPKPSRRSE